MQVHTVPEVLTQYGATGLKGPQMTQTELSDLESLLQTQLSHRRTIETVTETWYNDYDVFWVGGMEWGDEGKGRWVDGILAELREVLPNTPLAVARYQGGDNAGHTVVVGDEKYEFHILPSASIHEDVTCVLGGGMVINPVNMLTELDTLQSRLGDNYADFLVSERATVIMPWHQLLDGLKSGSIGTTGRGIGPAYESLVNRKDRISFTEFMEHPELFEDKVLDITKKVRAGIAGYVDAGLLDVDMAQVDEQLNAATIINQYSQVRDELEGIRKLKVGDDVAFLDNHIHARGGKLIGEGAQGTLLHVLRGTTPNVTSSDTSAGGLTGGAAPYLDRVLRIGVGKAMTTRVGGGALPTQMDIMYDDLEHRAELDEIYEDLPWTRDEERIYYGALATGHNPVHALVHNKLHGDKKTITQWAIDQFNSGLDKFFGLVMRLVGDEYGVTTGRGRRNGPKDLPALSYSISLNNPHELAITKLDVMTGLQQIPVCVGYRVDGELVAEPDYAQPLARIPPTEEQREKIQPVYAMMPGWQEDISGVRTMEELQKVAPAAYNYLRLIADYTGVPVSRVGVGPEREQYITGKVVPQAN